jgi:hypothetical protein
MWRCVELVPPPGSAGGKHPDGAWVELMVGAVRVESS